MTLLTHEQKTAMRLSIWEQSALRPRGLLERSGKRISEKINRIIPQKAHNAITATVKGIVRTTLFGAEYLPKGKVRRLLSLEEADEEAEQLLSLYRKIAAAEGAGTGAGGFMLGAVDFPALIAIKMKFLFELAHVYGYSTEHFAERIFLLGIFQFTYADPAQRKDILTRFKQWEEESSRWPSDKAYYRDMDWEQFQRDYRDALDFRKMLQLLPGIGAVAGAWANYSILDEIGEVAMNCYRMRRLADLKKLEKLKELKELEELERLEERLEEKLEEELDEK